MSGPPANKAGVDIYVVVDVLGYARSEPVTRYWLDARRVMDTGRA